MADIVTSFSRCVGLAMYKFFFLSVFVQFRSHLTKKFVTLQVFPASAAPK